MSDSKGASRVKKGDKALILIVLAVALGIFAWLYFGEGVGEKGPYALISVNSRVYHTIDLGKSKDEVVTYKDAGVTYTVEIKDHQICMKEIDCPDQICVHTGYTDKSYIPVICLPNRVMIEVNDSPAGEDSEVDNVAS